MKSLPEFTTAERRNEIFANRLGCLQSAPVVRLISEYSKGTAIYCHAQLKWQFLLIKGNSAVTTVQWYLG